MPAAPVKIFAEFDQGVARVPRWILLLAVLGTVGGLLVYGGSAAGGYLTGTLAAWVNFRLIERAVNRITDPAQANAAKAGNSTGLWIFIQFSGLILLALVILIVSGFSKPAAFLGLLAAPAAVILEVVFELVTLNR